jgi:hypothetical protein
VDPTIQPSEFTAEQIENWRRYEAVRKGGRFNMFDPRARKSTRLSADDYAFCMKNYSALRDAALAKAA